MAGAPGGAPADAPLGGVEGAGFAQMMKGLETGRLQVAARAPGVGHDHQRTHVSASRHAYRRHTYQDLLTMESGW